jgi:hypothetical protein
MNYFFGINNSIFQSQISVPKFQNRNSNMINAHIYKCYPGHKEWIFEKLSDKTLANDFYRIGHDEIRNNELYFLAYESDLINRDKLKLENYNQLTDTIPEYRANFRIFFTDKNKKGFSSYQSEYPYRMIKVKNSIISLLSSLLNVDAEKNYILLRNIYEDPLHINFNGYLVDVNKKQILEKYQLTTNFTNLIEIKNKFIKPDVYFVTDKFLGIPVFISENNTHLSMEHTHPPHTYIFSEKKYERVQKLKDKIHEIIS